MRLFFTQEQVGFAVGYSAAFLVKVQSYLFWKERTSFLLLMEQFVNRTINGEEFNDRLFQLHQKLVTEFESFSNDLILGKIKNFQVDSRSYGFGSLISFLMAECDNFSDDYEYREFYDSIKDCFFKLQQALNEE